MGCPCHHCPFLQHFRGKKLITLHIGENHVSENNVQIPDLPKFLEQLPPKAELRLILKTPDAQYKFCPFRKAAPYFKAAEFSASHWVGQRSLPDGTTYFMGLLPTPFMGRMVSLVAQSPFPVAGVYLWADLAMRSYFPLPEGWCFIWHQNYLLICQNGLLRISRMCYLPLPEELPAILRYLLRFGYKEGTLVPLLASSPINGLPDLIQQEVLAPLPLDAEIKAEKLTAKGIKIPVPALAGLQRLYKWPRLIRPLAWAFAIFNMAGFFYFAWEACAAHKTVIRLKRQVTAIPPASPLDENKMSAFAAFQEFKKGQPDPLPVLRQIMSGMQGKIRIAHLHWVAEPFRVTLHLEALTAAQDQHHQQTGQDGTPDSIPAQKPFRESPAAAFVSHLQTCFPRHSVRWKENAGNSLKGMVTID